MTDTFTDPGAQPSVESDIDTGRNVNTGEFSLYVNGEKVWTTGRNTIRSIRILTPLGEATAVRVAGGAVPWMDVVVEDAIPEDSNLPLDMVLANRALAAQDLAVGAGDRVAKNTPITHAEKDRLEGVDDQVTNPGRVNVEGANEPTGPNEGRDSSASETFNQSDEDNPETNSDVTIRDNPDADVANSGGTNTGREGNITGNLGIRL